MPLIIDSHVHVFPDPLVKLATHPVAASVIGSVLSQEHIAQLRRRARAWFRPVSTSIHAAQTVTRHFPEPLRNVMDQVSGLAPLPGLLIESTAADLLESMQEAEIQFSIVIAHPPMISNEDVLEICAEHPSLLPVVNIPSGTARPGQALKKFAERGAKALKIHPAADGEGVDSPRYRALLNAAADLGLPVILHTGCLHTHLLYRDPEQGHAQRFSPWFGKYRSIRFVLAHMNFHSPGVAIDLAEEFGNLYLETSWQPAEMIGEAVRRIGSDRVLFGTDWPFVGRNQAIGVSRVKDCVDSGIFEAAAAEKVLGTNSAKLFSIETESATDAARARENH